MDIGYMYESKEKLRPIESDITRMILMQMPCIISRLSCAIWINESKWVQGLNCKAEK